MATALVLMVNRSLTTDPNQDLLGIVIFFFDFTIFSVFFYALFNRIASAKAAKVWPKLAPSIQGTFHRGIGLTAPYLVGTYHGLPVRAHVRWFAKSRWNFDYYFDIVATLDTHGQDWELSYNRSPHVTHGWELKAKDEVLKQHLAHAGLMALLPNWDTTASVKYRGGKGTLRYSHQIYTRDDLPSPEVFQMQLALRKREGGGQ